MPRSVCQINLCMAGANYRAELHLSVEGEVDQETSNIKIFKLEPESVSKLGTQLSLRVPHIIRASLVLPQLGIIGKNFLHCQIVLPVIHPVTNSGNRRTMSRVIDLGKAIGPSIQNVFSDVLIFE